MHPGQSGIPVADRKDSIRLIVITDTCFFLNLANILKFSISTWPTFLYSLLSNYMRIPVYSLFSLLVYIIVMGEENKINLQRINVKL